MLLLQLWREEEASEGGSDGGREAGTLSPTEGREETEGGRLSLRNPSGRFGSGEASIHTVRMHSSPPDRIVGLWFANITVWTRRRQAACD